MIFSPTKALPSRSHKLRIIDLFCCAGGGGNCSVAAARDAMGINWMTKSELNEAIPPAYSHFIGSQLLAYLVSNHTRGSPSPL
jgi:hypothetical protein